MLLLPLAAGLAACLTPDPPAAATCTECHGYPPPPALGGSTDLLLVGAHARHAEPRIALAVACEECHLVPGTVNEPGHIDTDVPAEVIFAADGISSLGLDPVYDAESQTCVVYCHGDATPVWYGSALCETCHANPPPSPHPAAVPGSCAACHPDTATNPELHIDGVVELL